MTEPIKFQLGTGPFATSLVAAMLLAAGAYFGHAAYADLAEPIALGESLVLDQQVGWWLLVVLAAGAVLAGLYLILRTIRKVLPDLDPPNSITCVAALPSSFCASASERSIRGRR
jgi:hypothetical protein